VRWRTANKYPFIGISGAAAVIGAFVFLLSTVHANKIEQQNLACLALNIYFEATVCGVVYEKNWDALRRRYVSAFSWTEFKSRPEPTGAEWSRAQEIAADVYYGQHEPRLAGATHYHADRIAPSWSRHQTPVARIGNHVFYR